MNLPDPEAVSTTLLELAFQVPPVDLESIVRLWPGLRVSEEELDGEGYIVDLDAIGAEIVIRTQSSEVRKRYTLAHELGHWILRVGASIPLHEPGNRNRIAIERWCDRFAASLLMPREPIIQQLNAKEDGAVSRLLKEGPTKFGVSNQAYFLRLTEVAGAIIFVVREQAGRFKLVRSYLGTNTLIRDDHLIDYLPMIAGPRQQLLKSSGGNDCLFAWSLTAKPENRNRWVIGLFPTSEFEDGSLKYLDGRGMTNRHTRPANKQREVNVTDAIDFVEWTRRQQERLEASKCQ